MNGRPYLRIVMLVLCWSLLAPSRSFAWNPDTTVVTGAGTVLLRGMQLGIFPDLTGKVPFTRIQSFGVFRPPVQMVPNQGVTKTTIWLKFTLYNQTNEDELVVNIRNSHLNHIRLYYAFNQDAFYTYSDGGNQTEVSNLQYESQNTMFRVPIPPFSARTLFLRVQSTGEVVVPIYVGTTGEIINDMRRYDLSFGIYLGIIIIMLFYNTFLYFSIKDKSYLYYIAFIFFIGFSQFCGLGYGFRFIWSAVSYITLQSINWSVVLANIATILFARVFLKIPQRTPVFDKVLVGFIVLYGALLLLTLFGLYNVSYILTDVISFLCSFALWGIAIKYTELGDRPAKFFLISWSFFLLSIIIHVIRDFGGLPYNFLTNNSVLIGSAVEIALLSFALADTINQYREEKEQSQARALEISREKEQLVKNQNAILEERIQERTSKLQSLNLELHKALNHLKDTQTQLVDAEKMASLGQLTAGIAHEINNPINFVKSNIKPLQLDFADIRRLISKYEELDPGNIEAKLAEIRAFKDNIDYEYVLQEIAALLGGIEDGATRTADIVKGLRTFSRVNETELKEADLHEGLDTTLMLLTNIIPPNLSVEKHYGKIPRISCYPGKLNQVFMNILTNAIQAVASKGTSRPEQLTISTWKERQHVMVSIRDTGGGIPDDIREKIFDPFFTTKGVGEGTGLGLSIVYGIIEKHLGKIDVRSEVGVGTEFVITLPIHQSLTASPGTANMKETPENPV
jgi:signal transduction histidine kinase